MKKIPALILASLSIALLSSTHAAQFTDEFPNGINPLYWDVETNSANFSVQGVGGGVNIQSTTSSSTGFFWGHVNSTVTAYGNFDVSIDFTNAQLALHSGSGNRGNQAQLDCYFDLCATPTNFFMIRSDESSTGQSAHVWIGDFPNQGGFALRTISTTATSGTLRVTRTNSMISGYLNSTLVAQTNYMTSPVHFQLTLQDNGTEDALSITYGNFQITADQLTIGPLLSIQYLAPSNVVLSWPTWNVAWTTNYILQSTPSLDNPNWQPMATTPATNGNYQYLVTNAVGGTACFYRLQQE